MLLKGGKEEILFMKRLGITLLSLLLAIPLILGGVLAYFYYSTNDSAVPNPIFTVQDMQAERMGYDWIQPVFSGVTYREFTKQPVNTDIQELGTLNEQQLTVTLPSVREDDEDFTWTAVLLLQDTEQVFSGTIPELQKYTFSKAGKYILEIKAELKEPAENKESRGFGWLFYRFGFEIDIKPTLKTSDTTVKQGDVLAVELSRVGEETKPTIETNMAVGTEISFGQKEDGAYLALIPINYQVAAGKYKATVNADNFTEDIDFTVEAQSYVRQAVTVQNTTQEIKAQGSAASINQYNATLDALSEDTDSTTNVKWSGAFVEPVLGSVTTSYGSILTTTGISQSMRSTGINITADEGTVVSAPNPGKVILAKNLAYGGNTIVIDHGGGIKSYYTNLNTMTAKEGDVVEKSQAIGTVGTTGYSTTPHLHFEIRINNVPVNPVSFYGPAGNALFFNNSSVTSTSTSSSSSQSSQTTSSASSSYTTSTANSSTNATSSAASTSRVTSSVASTAN